MHIALLHYSFPFTFNLKTIRARPRILPSFIFENMLIVLDLFQKFIKTRTCAEGRFHVYKRTIWCCLMKSNDEHFNAKINISITKRQQLKLSYTKCIIIIIIIV